jgi:hypothetical protein
MALGGGVFLTQNKVLPGSYINFISASRASATLSDRGVAAVPLELDWGNDTDVFGVDSGQFQKESVKFFGYDYTDDNLKPLRDLFLNIRLGYFYRLNGGGAKAANTLATAVYSGTRGNDLTIIVEANEAFVEESNEVYDVTTALAGLAVDVQLEIKTMDDLKDSDWVTWARSATLEATAGMPLTGGTNGTVQNADYQTFLDKVESFSFNTLGCPSDDALIKALFAAFTKRMRDEVGIKFQCVVHRYTVPDYEGVISVENNASPELVYWATGASAGCAVNASNTNKVYNGEYAVDTDYTQRQLETALQEGKFIFHKVNDVVRVLEDVNTFISFTDDKNTDFSSNQTMRVLDQIGNDIAYLFNTKYLGKVPNDAAGRISLWNDIVKHHRELETLRAIEDFKPDTLTVEQGDTKKAVVVTDGVTPVNAMSQLFMTDIVQ